MIADSGSPSTTFMGSCRGVCVKPRLFGGQFSHAVSLQDEAMGIVDEPIQDGICDGGIADQFVPALSASSVKPAHIFCQLSGVAGPRNQKIPVNSIG